MQYHGLDIHVTKFEQITLPKNPKISHNLFCRSAKSAKIFTIFEKRKKPLIGARIPWLDSNK